MTILDPLAVTLASGQHGVLTTGQAHDCGISAPALVALVRGGALEHPGRGFYLLPVADEDADARHRRLCAAALMLYDDAMLSGTSALLAHGVAVWGDVPARPMIRRPVDRARGHAAFQVRTAFAEPVASDWGPTVPVAVAVVEHALERGVVPGVVSADAALHDRLMTEEQLDDAVAAVHSWRHGSRAVAMRAFVDGRRESAGESRCAVAFVLAGISVTPQVEIREPDGSLVARADFLVDGTKVIVEFDGRVKYDSGDPAVLWNEKRREDRLRRLGYTVVRITWADLERPGAVAAKVRAAIRAA